MKAKYILRGLGIGIIITAAAMGAYTRSAVASARADALSEYGIVEGADAELAEALEIETDTEEPASEWTEPIIERDEELESEINSVLDAAVAAETDISNEFETDAEAEANASEETQSTLEAESAENGESETSKEEQEAADTVEIVISKGDDSGSVSRKLYNAGVVESATDFDAFLMQHGYDKKINTGTKIISYGDTWQEIAEKLVK